MDDSFACIQHVQDGDNMSILSRMIGSLVLAILAFALLSSLYNNGATMIHEELFSATGIGILFFFMWIEWEFLRL